MKRCIVFDFDGVIADSFELAYDVRHILCPHVTREEYRARFNGNINEVNARITAHTDSCRTDVGFFDLYAPRMEHEAPVFPGMVEVITHLAETYTLVVVSSTITPPIREKLERSGIASCFAEILGNDVHPSKEEKLRMVFATHATRPDDCVFVTDTAGDVREAARVGVGSIGVSWGYQPREMVEKANPFLIVDSPRAIVGAVEQYFRRPIS